MKRLLALFTLSALMFTACGTPDVSDVAEPETLKEFPELEGPILAWQNMKNAADTEDCELFLSHMRILADATEEDCPAAFDYLDEIEAIDWSRSEWDANMGKVKIYEMDRGSLFSFILNSGTEVWGTEDRFWE